ncbi:MAG: pyruvate, phosphate dikinase [Armatimonadetes bacterium]|nr:pyruvate, phosphate dikinase [Armatimonadota bacterium]MDE2205531.1 pyruvate, phosphate dikinase [Armatimonadota bacterium]
MTKRVYMFHEGNARMRDLLGGKGANLAEMSNIGLPVPPGFTITTATCNEYYANGTQLPTGLMEDVRTALAAVERQMDRNFGSENRPLLVSVRSGARFSMPGMMDTVLNLGLNRTTLAGLIEETQNPRFVWDAYRRFIMMFANVAFDIDKKMFDDTLRDYKKTRGADSDLDLTAADLEHMAGVFLEIVQNRAGRPFPSDPYEQLQLAIEAVFRSWNTDRAIVYRRKEQIPDDLGTAVNVQTMVYGNAGSDCGTGVAFTRDPGTGERRMFGEYLMNAQGEDVVAGVRTPVPISALETQSPEIYRQFADLCDRLEQHYRDMQDIEFTIEHSKLFMLQCRAGKRAGPAAVKIAVDMVREGTITTDEAICRITGEHLDQLLHPRLDPAGVANATALAKGIAASPGAAVGIAVFDSHTAAERGVHGGAGEKVILVRDETNPDDVEGMLASQGVLTARGGKTSHAAVVARGFGIPCVAGAETIRVDDRNRQFQVGGVVVREGDLISLDGSTGEVFPGALPLLPAELGADFRELMTWADPKRRLRVRANADNPSDARTAVEMGAEGIGLCRTEHMFFQEDRLPIVQEMILAGSEPDREAALARLLPMQQLDFEGIFEAMDGKPVTIRLIDPPLHEFLPSHDELLEQATTMRVRGETGPERDRVEHLLSAVNGMREANPMLGLRGVRLSIVMPGIVAMQTRAIMQAAVAVKKRGVDVQPEIMIPLVGHVSELKTVQEQLERVARTVLAEAGSDIPYTFGTMIEVPRAALTAGELAELAQFFSFGTNDLTQMTFGFSRDDAGKFLAPYVESKILPADPFETIDQAGVGRLMRICIEDAQKVRPEIKLGICGEHGGDPESVKFCHKLGLNYVSCSPFRVPIARLAAAQAVVENAAERDR